MIWLARHRPYMTFGFIKSHALSPHHGLDMSEARVTELLSRYKESGVLLESSRGAADGRTLRTLELSEGHPIVIATRQLEPPRFEASRPAALAVSTVD